MLTAPKNRTKIWIIVKHWKPKIDLG